MIQNQPTISRIAGKVLHMTQEERAALHTAVTWLCNLSDYERAAWVKAVLSAQEPAHAGK